MVHFFDERSEIFISQNHTDRKLEIIKWENIPTIREETDITREILYVPVLCNNYLITFQYCILRIGTRQKHS